MTDRKYKREFGLREENAEKRVKLDINDSQALNSEITITLPSSTGTLANLSDVTGNTEFADNTFRIQDNGDSTKELAFEVSGVTTGTTRTLTVPDQNGTIALTSDIPDDDFADDVFRISDNGDSTKKVAFEVSGVTTSTTRTLTVPDESGTIALTSAFESGAFTPGTSGSSGIGTFTGLAGTYIKVGSYVHIQGRFGATTTTAAFSFSLTGLPFTLTTNGTRKAGGGTGTTASATRHHTIQFDNTSSGTTADFNGHSSATGTGDFEYHLQYEVG